MLWIRGKRARNLCAFAAGILVTSLLIYALQYKYTRTFGAYGGSSLEFGNEGEMVKKSRRAARRLLPSRFRFKKGRTKKGDLTTRLKNKHKYKHRQSSSRDIVVVFDFDETLGCFQELSDLSQAIANKRRRQLEPYEHAELLYMLPHYLRPGIIEQLAWLYNMKRNEVPSLKVMIYTNNMGGRKWVRDIASALELLVHESTHPSSPAAKRARGVRLFDQIIYAYSVDGVHLEKNRTSHEKKYRDFLACTRYEESTKVIFVDDVFHRGMRTPHVKYVHVPAYKWLYGRARIERMILSHYEGTSGDERIEHADIQGVLSCLHYETRPTDASVIRHHEGISVRLHEEIEGGIAWALQGDEGRGLVAGSTNYVAL